MSENSFSKKLKKIMKPLPFALATSMLTVALIFGWHKESEKPEEEELPEEDDPAINQFDKRMDRVLEKFPHPKGFAYVTQELLNEMYLDMMQHPPVGDEEKLFLMVKEEMMARIQQQKQPFVRPFLPLLNPDKK